MKPAKSVPHKDKIESEQIHTLLSHKAYMGDKMPIDTAQININDVISFMYDGSERLVYVIQPEYNLKLHGLTLNRIDRETLIAGIFLKLSSNTSVEQFYNRVVAQEPIKELDCYRTYDLRKMSRTCRVDYKFDSRHKSVADNIVKYVVEEVVEHLGDDA